MKNILLVSLILLMSKITFGQAAAITIINNHPYCGVYVTMYAISPATGNGTACDLMANNWYVPALTTLNYPAPDAFTTSIGWFRMTTSTTGPALRADSAFQWTDAGFQWDCPLSYRMSTGCGNNGAVMDDPTCSGSCYSSTGVTLWTSTTCTLLKAKWTTDMCLPYFNQVVTFY